MECDVDSLLTPIAGDLQSGPPYRLLDSHSNAKELFSYSRNSFAASRRGVSGKSEGPEEARALVDAYTNGISATWGPTHKAVCRALAESKSLLMGVYLCETSLRMQGLEGLKFALTVLSGLIVQFQGTLQPQPKREGGNYRHWNKMLRLFSDSGFIQAIRLAVVSPTNLGPSIRLQDLEFAQELTDASPIRVNELRDLGAVTFDELKKSAIQGIPEKGDQAVFVSAYAENRALVEACVKLTKEVLAALDAHAPGAEVAFTKLRKALNTLADFYDGILDGLDRRPIAPPVGVEKTKSPVPIGDTTHLKPPNEGKTQTKTSSRPEQHPPVKTISAFDQASTLAHTNGLDSGLRFLQAAINNATSQRDQFLLRLDLIDLCRKYKKTNLTRHLLIDIKKSVDQHKLEGWESPAVIARVRDAEVHVSISKDASVPPTNLDSLYRSVTSLCLSDIVRGDKQITEISNNM